MIKVSLVYRFLYLSLCHSKGVVCSKKKILRWFCFCDKDAFHLIVHKGFKDGGQIVIFFPNMDTFKNERKLYEHYNKTIDVDANIRAKCLKQITC